MSIYKRKSGRYAVLVEQDSSESRRRRSLGTFKTRKEAERAEREALTARDHGIELSPEHVTVGELLERYLTDRRVTGRCGDKTLERYEGIVRVNLTPHVGAIPLAKFKPAHVSELIAKLGTDGGHKGGALAARSVKHAYALLKGTLAWAVQQELVGRNVATAVTPPTVRRSNVQALPVEDALRFLELADGGRWGPFMRLAIATGARRGELLALRWSDFDATAATLTIRASLSQTKTGVQVKGTKTDRARPAELMLTGVEALKRQKALQAQDKLAAGGAFVDSGHIFQNALGGLIRPCRASEVFRELAERCGLKTTSLHNLRHTCLSWLIAAGVDIRTVASIAGHSTPNVTLSIYAHLIPGAQAKAMAAIDERLATPRERSS